MEIKRERSVHLVDDPHIDDTSPEITTDITGDVKYVKPNIGLFSASEEDLIVNLKLVVESGEWEMDPELVKYMNIQIVQSTDSEEKIDKLIKSGEMKFVRGEYSKLLTSQDYRISQLQSVDGEVQKSFKFTFVQSQATPDHVAYYANCFIDVEALETDFALDLPEQRKSTMYGPITSKMIYHNGEVQKTFKFNTKVDGTRYSGQAHISANGSLKTGEKVNDSLMAVDIEKLLETWLERDNTTLAGRYYADVLALLQNGNDLLRGMRRLLTTWKARNSKDLAGQYYRSLKAVYDFYLALSAQEEPLEAGVGTDRTIITEEASNINYEFLCDLDETISTEIGGTDNGVDQYLKSKLTNSRYFSDALITFAEPVMVNKKWGSGASRFLFSVDFINIFKNNVSYSCLLKNTNETIVEEMLKYINVKSIKILRQKMDNENNSTTEVITGLGNPISGKVLDERGKLLGMIKEIVGVNLEKSEAKTSLELPPEYRSFSVSDYGIEGLTSGTFKYIAVVTIEDKMVDFIRDRISSLSDAIYLLKNYLNLARLPCSYSSADEMFTKQFIDKQYRIATGNPSNAIWMVAPSIYADVLRCFANIENSDAFNIAVEFYKKLDPMTSTPEKIEEVIQEFLSLESLLLSKFDIQQGADQYSKGVSKSKIKNYLIEIEHTFSPEMVLTPSFSGINILK